MTLLACTLCISYRECGYVSITMEVWLLHLTFAQGEL